jgi:hypothetical protein
MARKPAASKPPAPTATKRPRRSRFRRLCAAERERAAYLIGAGASASEASEEIDGATPASIRSLARRMGLRFVDKKYGQAALTIVMADKAIEDATELAGNRGMAPEAMVARIIEELMVDRAKFRQIISGIMEPNFREQVALNEAAA